MEISASLVKELREKTGAGMMDCKKALAETAGDFEKAIEFLRKKGMASAAKKAGRATKEGLVASWLSPDTRVGVMLELNCETDFVARTEQFKAFVQQVGGHIASKNPSNVEALLAQDCSFAPGKTVQVVLQELIATLGENMALSRFTRFEASSGGKGTVATYIHGEGKVGVLLELGVGSPSALQSDAFKAYAKDLTMHIAAAAPQYLRASDVSAEILDKEREIARAQIQNAGKPMKPEFLEKAVEGRVRKVLEEFCLLTQPFVKDPGKTVEALTQETARALGQDLSIARFARFVLGEGQKETAETAH